MKRCFRLWLYIWKNKSLFDILENNSKENEVFAIIDKYIDDNKIYVIISWEE